MEVLLALALLAVVVWIVAGPLRPGRASAAETAQDSERRNLEAARDAKYREIREVELDYRTGKLSEADWRDQDRGLRREAIDILRRLDEAGPPLP